MREYLVETKQGEVWETLTTFPTRRDAAACARDLTEQGQIARWALTFETNG